MYCYHLELLTGWFMIWQNAWNVTFSEYRRVASWLGSRDAASTPHAQCLYLRNIFMIIRYCGWCVILYFSSEWPVIHWPKMNAACTCSCRRNLWIKTTPLLKLDKPEPVWTRHVLKKGPQAIREVWFIRNSNRILAWTVGHPKHLPHAEQIVNNNNNKTNVTSNYSWISHCVPLHLTKALVFNLPFLILDWVFFFKSNIELLISRFGLITRSWCVIIYLW